MKKIASKPKQPDTTQSQQLGFFVQGVAAKGTAKVISSGSQQVPAKNNQIGSQSKVVKAPVSHLSNTKNNSAVSSLAVSKNAKPNGGIVQTNHTKISSNAPKQIETHKQAEKQQQQLDVIQEDAFEQKESFINTHSSNKDTDKQEQQVKSEELLTNKGPVIGKVVIKYNHYNDSFEIVNGKINFATVDEKYCFSFIFKGNFIPKLKNIVSKEYLLPTKNRVFEGLEDGQQYVIEIDEDPDEVAKEVSKPYQAPKKEDEMKKNNNRIDQLTNELKGMSIEELKSKGDKYKEIIEARDLEDVLFS